MQKSKSEPNCQANTLSVLGYPKRKSTGNLRHVISRSSSSCSSPSSTTSNKVNWSHSFPLFYLLPSLSNPTCFINYLLNIDLASTWTLWNSWHLGTCLSQAKSTCRFRFTSDGYHKTSIQGNHPNPSFTDCQPTYLEIASVVSS